MVRLQVPFTYEIALLLRKSDDRVRRRSAVSKHPAATVEQKLLSTRLVRLKKAEQLGLG
jgi:hypothetical protein